MTKVPANKKSLFVLVLYIPVNNFSVMSKRIFHYAEDKVSCPITQYSASFEAKTRNPLISSRALYRVHTAKFV